MLPVGLMPWLLYSVVSTLLLLKLSVYTTYTSSLQAGDLAPAGTVNSGDSLAPYRSKQYEVGYKANFDTINFTAALFDLERPFANVNPLDNTFEITGTQVNKGLELSAVGDVINGLTVYGGITLLHSILEDTPLASTNDRLYVGTPKVKGNVLFEYHVPTVSGLVATFDYQFSGPRPGDDSNQFTVAGYNLFDVGGRYTLKMWGTPVAWRLAVDNVTGQYRQSGGPSWSAAHPGGIGYRQVLTRSGAEAVVIQPAACPLLSIGAERDTLHGWIRPR
jgi:iron complex outermembrane receptor protein